MRLTRLAQVEDDAVRLVQAADEAADLGAEHALERHAAPGATTCTSSPRARSDAATSSPMKLAPTTTARFAEAARGDDRPAVGERAQVVHCGRSAPGIVEPDRLGAGREQQRAERVLAPSSSRTRLRCSVERRRARAEHEVDPLLGVELRRPQRDPLLRRGAGEVVLRQVRPVVRRASRRR